MNAQRDNDLPRDRLMALSAVIDDLQPHLFRDDDTHLNQIAGDCKRLFDAEDVSVFVVSDDNPSVLELAAEYPGPPQAPLEPVRIPDYPPPPKCGLTGWCVIQQEASRFNWKELQDHPAVAGRVHDFVPSKECYSLLAVPVRLKPGRHLGLLKINNRLGPDGKPGRDVEFTEDDKSFAHILATKVAALLDARRVMRGQRDLTAAGDACREPKEYYREVLRVGLRLVRADRAMLALADARHVPFIRAMANPHGIEHPDRELPPSSVMRRCWDRLKPERIPNVDRCDYYHRYDSRTKSEAAVLLTWEGVRFGVLNVESDQLDHFDDHDLEVLKSLVPFIAASHRAVDKEEHFRQILEDLGTFRWTHTSVLNRLVETAVAQFGFANGHVFVPTEDGKALKLIARFGPQVNEAVVPEHALTGEIPSVQRLVYLTGKPLFSPAAEKDLRFNAEAIRLLKIRGAYLATPLLVEGRSVGVLSVWGESVDSRVPTIDDIPRLAGYARVAAAVVDLSATRRTLLRTIAGAIPTLQKPAGAAELWVRLLGIVQQAGFRRVRLFRYWPERNAFELLATIPPDSPPAGLMISAQWERNPYAFDTVRRAATDPHPFQYDGSQFGHDPDAARLGKTPGEPWTVIPLISHGTLYGQITADNSPGGPPVPDETLENLEVIGGVAALTVAQAETVAQLTWRSLDKLHAGIAFRDDERTVVRKLLVYLTHGDALGMARAGYFAYQPERQQFEFLTALGSVVKERYVEIAADHIPIEKVLAGASGYDDADIEAALRPVVISFEDVRAAGLLAPGFPARAYPKDGRPERPGWVAQLAEAIGSTDLLVTPVAGLGDEVYGLFVTDRKWQVRPVTGADEATLTGFGRHAALLLSRQEGPKQEIEAAVADERGLIWKDVALVTSHRISTPISTIDTEHDNLKTVLADAGRDVSDTLNNMKAAIATANVVVGQFRVLRDVYYKLRDAPPSEVPLTELLNTVRQRAGNTRVRILASVGEVVYVGHRYPLQECLVELVANGCYWAWGSRDKRDPVVHVGAAAVDTHDPYGRPKRFIRITVLDTGPGLPASIRDGLGKGLVVPAKPGGSGFGLFYVHEVVGALGGKLTHANPDAGGCSFEMTIPQLDIPTP